RGSSDRGINSEAVYAAKALDALGVTQRLGMGAGRAKRSVAATCTPATWRTDKAPWGAASVGDATSVARRRAKPEVGGFRGAVCPHDKATCAKRSVATWGSLVLVRASR